jgi:hypothetical protein
MSDISENKKTVNEIISLSLSDFETPVLKGNYAEAEKVLQKLMQNQRKGVMTFNLRPAGRKLSTSQNLTESYQIIEKLATLITKMFCDVNYKPSEWMFNEFVLGKKFIAYLFAASSYQNTDHIIVNLGLDTKGNYTKEDIRKFLISFVPDSSFDLPWVKLASHMPSEVCRGYLGLMTSFGLILSDIANSKSTRIAGISKEMPLIRYSRPQNLEAMSSAFFNVSNFVGKEKFEFKKWAAKNYKKFMAEFMDDNANKSPTNTDFKIKNKVYDDKKTVLIIHEHYRHGHAMYRCYHSLFSALKDDFNVLGLSATSLVDDIGKKDHHEFIDIKDINDIKGMIEKISIVAPDVILYSSIGMSNFTPLLASVRLAPIQCVCPGHPSSSYIDTVDYLLLEDMGLSENELSNITSEKTIVIETEALKIKPNTFTLKGIIKEPETCNIAINGVIQKVSSQLLNICNEISNGINREVRFHFFMTHQRQDLDYYAALSVLRRTLPNSILHPFASYDEYMNTVNQCDFALPTMPFGGANSNIDVARLAIPKLFVKDTSDLPGVTDYYIWKELGELKGLCTSHDNLVMRAIELGNDKGELLAFKELLRAINIDDFMIKDNEKGVDVRLVKALNSILN